MKTHRAVNIEGNIHRLLTDIYVSKTMKPVEPQYQEVAARIIQANVEMRDLKKVISDVLSVLDKKLGDTDPSIPEDWDDETIKEEEPIFWCFQKLSSYHQVDEGK